MLLSKVKKKIKKYLTIIDIIDYIVQQKSITLTPKKISHKFNIPLSTVYRYIDNWYKENYVEKIEIRCQGAKNKKWVFWR